MAAPVIVVAELGPADFAWLDRLRRAHYPPDRNRVPAHLTLFRHLPPSLLPELGRRLGVEARAERPAAAIGWPVRLEEGVALGVRSEALEAIRARLAAAFAGLLISQDAAGWRPHVTIQNKAGPAEARALHGRMMAELARPRPLLLTGLASFHYRGGPWEPIARYRFAG